MKIDPLITVCIVTFNDADFILNNLYCLDKTMKNTYKVIIRDNNSKLKEYLKLTKNIKKNSNVELYRVENFHYRGSMAHGTAINDLVSRIDTKYGVILDADCTFLYRNWDDLLINEIDENCPVFGTQAALGFGGEKPGDFPLMYGIIFIAETLKKLQIDFRPINPMEFQDTGYKLREEYLKRGYKGKILYGRNTRKFKTGPFSKIICTEYYKEGINEIFACHFGRGATYGLAKYRKKRKKDETKGHVKFPYMIPVLGKRFLKLKGKTQKKKWIKICKELVDSKSIL